MPDTPDQRLSAPPPTVAKTLMISDLELGAEVVAAPTPYTAFDYLHERAFDGAVLWGDRSHAPALAIAAGMRRNTRLYALLNTTGTAARKPIAGSAWTRCWPRGVPWPICVTCNARTVLK